MDNVAGARSMAISDKGILFVGTRLQGNVYAIIDEDKDNKGDFVLLIASGLKQPNGIAYQNRSLFVMDMNELWRFDSIDDQILSNLPSNLLKSTSFPIEMKIKPKGTLLTNTFPSDYWHSWKYIKFGPDGLLYVPVGAPCNVCIREDPRYSTIMRQVHLGTWDFEIFASGVRNSIGFDWSPSGEFWFTENGRDFAGHDYPPDELNVLRNNKTHFGFPYCYGQNERDIEIESVSDCSKYVPSIMDFPPHVAPLGMKFYHGEMFPSQYTGNILIAEHGSWNRISPTGYKVSRVEIKNGKFASYTDFMVGFLQDKNGETAFCGRPVDILILKDGSILVSDDHANQIYRITYKKP